MILFVRLDSLKSYNLSRMEKDTILLLIVAYKNKTHIDFHGKSRFVDSKCNSYHIRLINSIISKVQSWEKTFKVPKQIIIPQKWPTGERFPTLADISQNQKYYSVNNLWMSREELIGEHELILKTQIDADLAILAEECDQKYRLLANKYI